MKKERADRGWVRGLLAEVYRSEGVKLWLDSKQMRFEGLSPLEMLDRDPLWVFDVIEQMRSGAAT